jgi:hypothetical protein
MGEWVQYAGNVDAMAKWLRVSSLGYLAPEGLVEAATRSSGDERRTRASNHGHVIVVAGPPPPPAGASLHMTARHVTLT